MHNTMNQGMNIPLQRRVPQAAPPSIINMIAPTIIFQNFPGDLRSLAMSKLMTKDPLSKVKRLNNLSEQQPDVDQPAPDRPRRGRKPKNAAAASTSRPGYLYAGTLDQRRGN